MNSSKENWQSIQFMDTQFALRRLTMMSQRCLCAWLWYRIFLSCDVHTSWFIYLRLRGAVHIKGDSCFTHSTSDNLYNLLPCISTESTWPYQPIEQYILKGILPKIKISFFLCFPSGLTHLFIFWALSNTSYNFWNATFSSALIFPWQLLCGFDPKFDPRDTCMSGADWTKLTLTSSGT